MDGIFYLVASYDRLFGEGHCTGSMVKTRIKILAAKPAVLPAVRILVIPPEETNDPGGQANKISFRSPMLSDSFVGRKERRRVCQLRASSYVHQVRTLEVLLKAVRRRWNETNASRRRHIF